MIVPGGSITCIRLIGRSQSASTRPPAAASRLAGRLALFLPIAGCGGKDSVAARRLRRAVQCVCCRAPDGVVGRGAMRFKRRLVPVGFEEVVDVLVLHILKNVEAQTARLVPLGTEGIDLDRLQKTLALIGLH